MLHDKICYVQESFNQSSQVVREVYLDLQEFSNSIDYLIDNVGKNWKQFQFLNIYCKMVARLMTFVEASRTRNWDLYLSSAEDKI